MRHFTNIVSGFFAGISPVFVATIISISVYQSLPNYKGVLIGFVCVGLSVWLGIKIFSLIQKIGYVEFKSAVRATPDLDNLEPTPDSETKRKTPTELVEHINQKKLAFTQGSWRIFGDWYGGPYEDYRKMDRAFFNEQKNCLTISFADLTSLEIYNPKHILESSTFLKIIEADRIIFFWNDRKNEAGEQYFLDYIKEKKQIKTNTNVDWYYPDFHLSLGDPALMIYGEFDIE